MKIIHVIFILLLAIAGVTGFILLSVPPENAAGLAQGTFAGMKVGGDGSARLAPIGNAPYYFQGLVILLAVSMLYMGVAPHRRTRGFKLFLVVGGLIALAVWSALYTGYLAYLETGQTSLVFGFPAPTVWMMAGVWGSFALFDLFYCFAFRRYFLPLEDEQAFHDLIAELKADQVAGGQK